MNAINHERVQMPANTIAHNVNMNGVCGTVINNNVINGNNTVVAAALSHMVPASIPSGAVTNHSNPIPPAYNHEPHATNSMMIDQMSNVMPPPHPAHMASGSTQIMTAGVPITVQPGYHATEGTINHPAMNPVTSSYIVNNNSSMNNVSNINSNVGCNTNIVNSGNYYVPVDNVVANNQLNNTVVNGVPGDFMKPAHVIYRSYFERDDDHLSDELR